MDQRTRIQDVVSVWECSKPPLKKKQWFQKDFIPYPYYIVFDFEALLKILNQHQTNDLTYVAEQIPISVAICDNLTNDPIFIVHEDPKELIRLFVKELKRRQKLIVEAIEEMYPKPADFEMLPKSVQEDWNRWLNQVPVIGFNSGKYDINLIKRYFAEEIAKFDDDESQNPRFL